MKKYVVKNCPAYKGYCTNEFRYGQCLEISDCLIKQIIEKCKKEMQESEKWKIHGYLLADDILQLFDIQEVD